MAWKDVIELGEMIEDVIHYETVKSWSYRKVHANRKSVRQSEVYQASAVGLKPELMFEIHTIDYSQEERIKYNTKVYEIIRVFEKGEVTELVVSAFIGSDVDG